jgi:hypothetical protein
MKITNKRKERVQHSSISSTENVKNTFSIRYTLYIVVYIYKVIETCKNVPYIKVYYGHSIN